MHKTAVVFAVGLSLAAPSYANDIWQFTVTSDQNGPNGTCNEDADTLCSITGHNSPYLLAAIEVTAPVTGYVSVDDIACSGPISVIFDDKHLNAFVASSALGLSGLNWPPPTGGLLVTNVAVNEQPGSLSGAITMYVACRPNDIIVMTGMNNWWTGYWYKRGSPLHQFWARSDKVSTITVH